MNSWPSNALSALILALFSELNALDRNVGSDRALFPHDSCLHGWFANHLCAVSCSLCWLLSSASNAYPCTFKKMGAFSNLGFTLNEVCKDYPSFWHFLVWDEYIVWNKPCEIAIKENNNEHEQYMSLISCCSICQSRCLRQRGSKKMTIIYRTMK